MESYDYIKLFSLDFDIDEFPFPKHNIVEFPFPECDINNIIQKYVPPKPTEYFKNKLLDDSAPQLFQYFDDFTDEVVETWKDKKTTDIINKYYNNGTTVHNDDDVSVCKRDNAKKRISIKFVRKNSANDE